MKYKKILIKLSGEALAGTAKHGWDINILNNFAKELKYLNTQNIQVAVVIGGGNIFRGLKGLGKGFNRINGDYMGMIATVMNVLALESFLKNNNVKTEAFSSIKIGEFVKEYNQKEALKLYNNNNIIILGGGLGVPYLTTDTTAAIRALELNAEILIKATKVDGIYDKDPEIEKDAKKIDFISFDKVINNNLKVLDLSAITICKENNLKIGILNLFKNNSLINFIKGIQTGSIIGG